MQVGEVVAVLDSVVGLGIQQLEDVEIETLPDGVLSLVTGGDEFMLRGKPRASFLKTLGVTPKIMNRLTRDTSTTMLNELYDHSGHVSIIHDGSEAKSFVPNGRYTSIPVEFVLTCINEAIGPSVVNYEKAHVYPNYDVRLEVSGGNESRVITDAKKDVGDMVKGGAIVHFNPLGITDPYVQTYGQRLVCTNGMTSTEVMRSYELGNSDGENYSTLIAWMRDSVREAYTSIGEAVNKWTRLADDKLAPQDRPLLIGAIAKDAKLKGNAAEAFMARAMEEPPESSYDVLNLLTWLSSHVQEDPDAIQRAQNVAANFADARLHGKYCPTCRRAA